MTTVGSLQEEEGEEYAAYHQGVGHEAHAEGIQLVQPLGEGSAEGQSSSEEAKLVALCKSELNSVTGASQHGACARYVSLCYKGAFGGCGRFVKQSRHSNFSSPRSTSRNPCYEPRKYTACSSGGPEEWVPGEPDNWPGGYQTTPSPGWDWTPVPEGAFA